MKFVCCNLSNWFLALRWEAEERVKRGKKSWGLGIRTRREKCCRLTWLHGTAGLKKKLLQTEWFGFHVVICKGANSSLYSAGWLGMSLECAHTRRNAQLPRQIPPRSIACSDTRAALAQLWRVMLCQAPLFVSFPGSPMGTSFTPQLACSWHGS